MKGSLFFKTSAIGDLPGDSVVKNSPANVGNTGLISGSGRFHMLWGGTNAPQLLSPWPRARELQLLKPALLEPMLRNKKPLL